MEEEQQLILEQEPLKVLSLFRKRQVNTLSISSEKYVKLFDALSCTICRDIFNNPVYLKCSHRFCKECIEKYIRSNIKKSCPNCRGGLNTKRDLHIDYGIQSLINYAFVDVKKLSKDIFQLDNNLIENRKVVELKKQTIIVETRQRSRPQIPQQGLQLSKKMKTNDGQQIRKLRRRETSEKKLETKNIIQQKVQFGLVKNNSEIDSVREQKNINPKELIIKNRKKRIQFIEIKSNSSEEQQDAKSIQQIALSKNIDAKSNNIEIQLNQREQKLDQLQNQPGIQTNLIDKHNQLKQSQHIQQSIKVLDQINKHTEEKQNSVIGYSYATKIFEEQFGDNYKFKILQIENFPLLVEIQLQNYPNSPFTPNIPTNKIKVSLKATISAILSFISGSININKDAIKLFIRNEQNNFIQISPNQKLLQINEKQWKNVQGIQILELQQMIDRLSFKDIPKKLSLEHRKKRIIFYSVDFTKISF